MTLELNRLTEAVEQMAEAMARREEGFAARLARARQWLEEFAHAGQDLRKSAETAGTAIPTDEPLNSVVPAPQAPPRFTAIGADGSTIPPDRHGTALYYLINIGSLVFRHGSGETPVAASEPHLAYRDEELYEGTMLISGALLDLRRDQAEIKHLARLVDMEPDGPTLALVDGTLLLWALEQWPRSQQEREVQEYLAALGRIRRKGAAVAGFVSRPRHTEASRLLLLAGAEMGEEAARAAEEERVPVPDQAIFSHLPAGCRSALFSSPSRINRDHYAPAGHEILFFYLNVAKEGEEAIVARVEVPRWVKETPELLNLVHAGIVAQSRIVGGYPYVLARADELAYISAAERQRLDEMVQTEMLRAGLRPALSPKAYYKSLTRTGRRW